MVFEALIKPITAEKRPLRVFVLGAFYVSLSIFLSLWIFREYSSLIMVFLTVMLSMPLIYGMIKLEEAKDIELDSESTILREHGRALALLAFLFLGFTFAFSFWYLVLPTDVSVDLYHSQIQTITNINLQISGEAIGNFSTFTKIFFNNVKVLTFCILFAFIFGLGAIFILTWNAAVLGTAVGNFIRSQLSLYAAEHGYIGAAGYFQAVGMSILRYFIHGLPEMTAYFLGGLAGGIISVAIIKRHFLTQKFEKVIFDSSQLIILSLLILLVAGLLEVYVTPLLF